MKPPICEICHSRNFSNSESSGLIQFALSKDDKEFNQRFKQPGFVGHPRGLAWFCEKHYQLAKIYTHLTLKEAIEKIKEQTI